MPGGLRTTLYGLALAAAFLETPFSIATSILDGVSPHMWIFGKLAGAFSVVTWAWVVVLLFFNDRPRSLHTLTRTSAHFISFAVFTIIWLALSIMLSTQFALECNPTNPQDGDAVLWCAMGGITVGLAFLVFILSGISASVVYIAAKNAGGGLWLNVANTELLALADGDSA